MNSEVKAQWVAALRSGDYKQGTGTLQRKLEDGSVTWCCLGVLCDLAIKAGVPLYMQSPEVGDVSYSAHPNLGSGSRSYPPNVVANWAGLGSLNPIVALSDIGTIFLTDANDGGYDFERIANLIEEQL